jgi:hypothetical protein
MNLFKFYRNLKLSYPRKQILLSLSEEIMLNFLDNRPMQLKLDHIYWPLSLGGNTLIENVIFHSMNNFIYYEKSISKLISLALDVNTMK